MEPKTQFRNLVGNEIRPFLEKKSSEHLYPPFEAKLQDIFGQEFSLFLRRQLHSKIRIELKSANQS